MAESEASDPPVASVVKAYANQRPASGTCMLKPPSRHKNNKHNHADEQDVSVSLFYPIFTNCILSYRSSNDQCILWGDVGSISRWKTMQSAAF